MSLPNNTIWHVWHSAFVMKLANKVFVFDYTLPKQTKNIQINANTLVPNGPSLEDLENEEVFVFASHHHGDHFSPAIFSWAKHIPNITYVLSEDIAKPLTRPKIYWLTHWFWRDQFSRKKPNNEIAVATPETALSLHDMGIHSYPSTDLGVAFSIFYEGKHIYFAGDNAFWNWDAEPQAEQQYEKYVLSPIQKHGPVDIAFQVCDPRLADVGAGGVFLFAKHLNPKLLIPIHSFGDYAFNKKAQQELDAQGFSNAFWCVNGPGDRFSM